MAYCNWIKIHEAAERLRAQGWTAKEAALQLIRETSGAMYHGYYFENDREADIINLVGDVYFN
jgi:hypothetical protein